MIGDLTTFAALKERMKFLQTRQKLLRRMSRTRIRPASSRRISRQLGVDVATRGSDACRARLQGGALWRALCTLDSCRIRMHLGLGGAVWRRVRGSRRELRDRALPAMR